MINWNECKPLDSEALDKVARMAVAGDSQAIEILIKANIRLASKIANKYRNLDGMSTEDLVSEAIVGLIEAIPGYDPEKGVKFTTYACWHIRKRVLLYVIDNFRLIKVGTTAAQRKIFWRINRESRALARAGIDVTSQTLADRIGVKCKEIEDMQIRMGSSEASLDATNPDDSQGASLLDTLSDGQESPESYTTRSRMTSWVQARMIEFEQRLSTTDQVIWNYRIASEDQWTLQEIADQVGVSRQYVDVTAKRLQGDFEKYARNQARD